jgi:hypothetical protein
LQQQGGFYSADIHTRIYNETNEVRMLGQDVLADFWQIDFSNLFQTRLKDFWATDSEAYRTLAKINFIARALEELSSGTLHPEHFSTVMKAAASSFSTPASLENLHQRDRAPTGLSIRPLDIGGYMASDILRIVDERQRQIVYVPNENGAFHVFETVADLHWWLLRQTSDAKQAPLLMSHFPLSSYAAKGTDVGLHNVLATLSMSYLRDDSSAINLNDHAIEGDAFEWLCGCARERMQEEARTSLQSNAELRKELWIGYLGAAANVSGALGTLCWPVALAALGADLASLGLNIDQAVNGRNTMQRKAGVIGAIFSSIDALLNSLVVVGAAGQIRSLGEATTVADANAAPLSPIEAVPLPAHLANEVENNPIQDFIANIQLRGTPNDSGLLKGIHTPRDGNFYIQLGDLPYQVRYLGEMKSWAIIDPAEPYSFFRHVPIKLGDNGQWSLLEKQGLRGGGKFFGLKPWGSARTISKPAPLPDSPYDVPERYKAKLAQTAADYAHYESELWSTVDPQYNEAIKFFENLRKRLLEDAGSFFRRYEQTTRPAIPDLERNATTKTIIKTLFGKSDGLVVGESHSSIASKKFLMENMGTLAKQKVKVLYMEHVMADMHHTDLEQFNRTGEMSSTLRNYLQVLDFGQRTDSAGIYTFEALFKSANDHHIQIRAIDCMASYIQSDLPTAITQPRQKMMNFYACKAIRADQQLNGPTRWVALVGNSHSNTFERVPGLSEMNNAIGLRIADVPPGGPTGISKDSGAYFPSSSSANRTAFVKGDLLLTLDTLPPASTVSLETRLSQAGMFILEKTAAQHVLIHRSKTSELVRTPIERYLSGVRIVRPNWPTISGRWYRNEQQLIAALKVLGMRQVS